MLSKNTDQVFVTRKKIHNQQSDLSQNEKYNKTKIYINFPLKVTTTSLFFFFIYKVKKN